MQISNEEIGLLCERLLFGGVAGGATAIRALMSDDLSSRDLMLNVLGPVSRRFDDLWQADRATFLDVRIATVRIEAFLRDIANPVLPIVKRNHRQAIFANVPGDEHTLGVKIAAELQRAKGWDIELATNMSYTELVSQISISSANILGLSIGSSASVHRLNTLVRSLRGVRPDLKILVSGALIALDERSIRLLGADGFSHTYEGAETILNDFAAGSVFVDPWANR